MLPSLSTNVNANQIKTTTKLEKIKETRKNENENSLYLLLDNNLITPLCFPTKSLDVLHASVTESFSKFLLN